MWTRIGGIDGGTVGALVVVPSPLGRPALLAVTPAGLFGTALGGGVALGGGADVDRAWRPLSAESGPPLADAIAVSPAFARDETLFVASRTGLYRSADRGQQWQLLLTGEILSVAISPDFAADGTVLVGSGQDGVLRSEDRGADWSGANVGLLDLTILALAVSPAFAADRTAFVGTASGFYRSRNGARSWREVNLGLAAPAIQVVAVSPAFAHDRLVLVGTEADGLLRSTDGGARFQPVPELAERGISAVQIGADGRTVLVAAGPELFRSDDAGQTWTSLPEAPAAILGLALLPVPEAAPDAAPNADRDAPSATGGAADTGGVQIMAGLHRLGVAALDEAGGWQLANAGLRASLLTRLLPVSGAAVAGEAAGLLALSLDDGVLRSGDGGATWVRCWPDDADPSISAVAVGDGGTVLASTPSALLRSDDAGLSWVALDADAAPPFRALARIPARGAEAGFVGVAIGGAAVPTNGSSAGGRPPGQILRSDEAGRRWGSVGRIVAGEPGRVTDVVGIAASPAYAQDRTLFAWGTETRADGQVTLRLWRSTDGGRVWEVWFSEVGGADALLPTSLLVSPSYPRDGRVLLAVGGRVVTPAPNAWERRGGRRRPVWQAVEVGPAVASVTALLAGAGGGQTIYATTNAGPYVSRDGGASFEPWTAGYDGGGLVSLAHVPGAEPGGRVLALGVGGTIWSHPTEA